MVLVTFQCDAKDCENQAQGKMGDRPKGWYLFRWVPGAITPPGGLPASKTRDKHACSDKCAEWIKEND